MASGRWEDWTGKLRRAETYAVVTAVAFIALIALAALLTDGRRVLDHVLGLGPLVIPTLLGLSLVNYGARLARWHIFSTEVGAVVPFSQSFLCYFSGFALTATPGKIGEILRLWFLRRRHGYRYERTAPLLVADRLSDSAAVMMICVGCIAAFAGHMVSTLIAAVITATVTALFLFPRLLIGVVEFGYAKIGRWPRLFARVRTTLKLAGRLASWRVYGGTLVLALIGWTAEVLAFYWLCVSLGAPVSFAQAGFIFTFSMLVGAIMLLPGGLGGMDATMIGLLIAIGVVPDLAVAATAIIRVTSLWFAVGLGFLFLPLALRQARGPTVKAA